MTHNCAEGCDGNCRHVWEIEPHYDSDFDVLVVDDLDAWDEIIRALEAIYDNMAAGDERTLTIRFNGPRVAAETSAPRVEDIGQKLVVSASRDLLARARSTLFVFTGEDFDMGDAAEATQLVTEIDRLLDLTSSGDTVSEKDG